jgi:outer membrane receptor protein involved in Fe transport
MADPSSLHVRRSTPEDSPAAPSADAELAYRWRNYTFAAGAENLFDNFPDRNLVFREGTTTFTAQSNTACSRTPASHRSA